MTDEVQDDVRLDDPTQQTEAVQQDHVAETATAEGQHDAAQAGEHESEASQIASCHPNLRHYGRGLCKNCWQREWVKTRPKRIYPDGYMQEYYRKNRSVIIDRTKMNKKKYADQNRSYILEYLAVHPCVDCGEHDPVVLDFDHVTGTKVDDIARMRTTYPLSSIRKEIEKCEVRCANCHRRRTAERSSTNYRLRSGAAISLAIN